MKFVTGKSHVTPALDKGVQQLFVGQKGVVVGAPRLCYGDAGLAGYVNAKSYVIYEVEVVSAVGAEGAEEAEEGGGCRWDRWQ